MAVKENASAWRIPGWIQFSYEEPFTCRSVTITPDGGNFQAQRLILEASDDGMTFRTASRLQPPRHGWQNGSGKVTHAIPPTTAKYFRFLFDKEGSEPGSEDLDSAKWSPVLKLKQIELSSEPRIHQFRGKNGQVYRVSPRTTRRQVADENCVPLSDVQVFTGQLDSQGRLTWNVPPGNWTILRFGHTSTGSRNETGGGGKRPGVRQAEHGRGAASIRPVVRRNDSESRTQTGKPCVERLPRR